MVKDKQDKAPKLFHWLTILSLLLVIIGLILFIIFKKVPAADTGNVKSPTISILVPLLVNLLASIFVIILTLIFYDRFQDNTTERLIKEYHLAPGDVCNVETCTSENQCPHELKLLQRTISEFLENNTNEHKAIIRQIIQKRLEYLNGQLEGIENNNWKVFSINDVSPTDADLTFNLISEIILKQYNKPCIFGSTILSYIPWWITSPGLNYLEDQKKINVTRVFLFPNKILDDLFPNFHSPKYDIIRAIENKHHQHKTFNQEQDTLKYLDFTKWILLLHFCLDIETYVLTPYFANNGVDISTIDSKTKTDIAIFGINDDISNPICSIEVEHSTFIPSKSLNPKRGTLTFSSDELIHFKDIELKYSYQYFDYVLNNFQNLTTNIIKMAKVIYPNCNPILFTNSATIKETFKKLLLENKNRNLNMAMFDLEDLFNNPF